MQQITEGELIEIEQRAEKLEDQSTDEDGEIVNYPAVALVRDVERLIEIARRSGSK